MNWRISILLTLFVFSACKQDKTVETDSVMDKLEDKNITYLIEVDEFQNIVHKPNIKIIDLRNPEIYAKEHIKDALNIWRTDIEDVSYPYKGMMASKKQIETLFSNLGIKNGDTLVLYDDNGLCDSARLWWLLQNYDFTNVRLLHGGISAWKTNKGSVSNEKSPIKVSQFELTDNPSLKFYISKEEMLKAAASKTILLDTRTTDEFTGKRQKRGALKGGRIPHSKLIDWSEAIEYHGNKKIKSIEELNRIYNRLNVSKDDAIIVYCHSGVRSAHTTFVLTQLLGYKKVKNYDGSWTEWSYFDDLPFERDSITTIKK